MNSDRRPPIERGAEGAPLRDHDLKRGLGSAFGVRKSPLRPAGRWLDTNLGGSGILRDELRHIFPDSWAFFLGEIALY
jgi:hypothetical protein